MKRYIILLLMALMSLLPISLLANTGVKVDYTLKIEDYTTHEAFVTMQIDEVRTSQLELEELGWGERNIKGQIYDLQATNEKGERLLVKQEETQNYNFTIETKGAGSIQVTYRIIKEDRLTNNHNVMGYIGEGYGVFSGGQMLLATKEKHGLQSVTLKFELPEGSTIAAPFYEEEGVYYPNYYSVKTTKKEDETEWDDAYLSLYASTMGVGNFKRIEGPIIDHTQVVTYVHNDLKYQEDLAHNIEQVIQYQTALFGEGATKEQVPYYVIVFPEMTTEKIWSGESPFSQGVGIRSNQEPLHDFYAHQTFHRWNGWLWGWNLKHNTHKDEIFRLLMNEGLNRYYEGKFIIDHMETLLNVKPGDIHYLTQLYNNFKNDCPSDPAYINGEDPYGEGALFWLFLDLNMLEQSNGRIGVDQVVAELQKQYGNKKQQMDYKKVMQCIRQVTGYDYTHYFERYIFGEGGLATALEPYFKDTDGDKYQDYVELLRGTPIYEETTYEVKSLQTILETGPTHYESQKEFLLVGSKEASERVRQKGKGGSGAGMSNFLHQKLYEQHADSILLIDLQNDKGYLPALKRLIPDLKLEVGLRKYESQGKSFTVLIGKNAEELMKLIELKL